MKYRAKNNNVSYNLTKDDTINNVIKMSTEIVDLCDLIEIEPKININLEKRLDEWLQVFSILTEVKEISYDDQLSTITDYIVRSKKSKPFKIAYDE